MRPWRRQPRGLERQGGADANAGKACYVDRDILASMRRSGMLEELQHRGHRHLRRAGYVGANGVCEGEWLLLELAGAFWGWAGCFGMSEMCLRRACSSSRLRWRPF
eukprot:5600914-Pleurochrysis_carterae.AAC.5